MVSAQDRKRYGDGRARHISQATHAQERAGHGCARVARADHRAGFAVSHGFSRSHHRGVFETAYGRARVGVHVYHFGSGY